MPPCDDADKQINTTTDEHGCQHHTCDCKPVDEVNCTLPKTLSTTVKANGCPLKECKCPDTSDTCVDTNKEAVKSSNGGCDIWTCQCKDVADPPCTLPKTIQADTIEGSDCPGKKCACPSWASADDCDADQEIVDETTEVCGDIRTCKCKTIPDEVCTGNKVLVPVDVVGSTNGCKKNICQCPVKCPQLVDCGAGLENIDSQPDDCGCVTRTCKCIENPVAQGCQVQVDYTGKVEVEPEWVTKDEIEMKKCSGECVSRSLWSDASKSFSKACTCCSVEATETKTFEVVHKVTNATKTVTIEMPTLCNCAATQCVDADNN